MLSLSSSHLCRLPMPDGFTPVSISLFDAQVSLIATRYTLRGINVLVHCRGGVGRAGLTACAWAIKMGYVQPHPSLSVVEQRALEQARARERERAVQAQYQHQQRQEQQLELQRQSSAPVSKGYKGFSLFPRSSSSSSNASTPLNPLSQSKTPVGSTTPGSAPMGSAIASFQNTATSPPNPISTSAAIPAELEHQIVMSTVERVIAMIRARRGLKAIESFEQVQFLVEYVRWLRAGA